jgi:hypothetical protein
MGNALQIKQCDREATFARDRIRCSPQTRKLCEKKNHHDVSQCVANGALACRGVCYGRADSVRRRW